jgi:hypothetical protein
MIQPQRRPAGPALQLVKAGPDPQTVACLQYLLELATRGELVGLAYGAMMRGDRYLTDFTGCCEDEVLRARGMVAALDDLLGEAARQA